MSRHSDNQSKALQISYYSIAINIFLIVIKVVVARFSNSISVMSDAVHSLTDMVTTVAVIVSIIISRKPADKDHPFGHGRVEDIGGVFVSMFLMGVGFNFLKESFFRLFHPQEVTISYIFVFCICVTALIKMVLGIYTHRIAVKTNSAILRTDAAHHYSDFYTSAVVAVGLFFVKFGYNFIDSILGIIVSVIIIVWAFGLIKEFLDNLIGKGLSAEKYEQVENIAMSFPNVVSVHDIIFHSYGKKFIGSIHVVVSRDLALEQAHHLADSIENKIAQSGIGKCTVHIDITDIDEDIRWKKTEVEKELEKFIQKQRGRIKSFHDIDVVCTEDRHILNFHMVLDKDTSLEIAHELSHQFSEYLQEKFKFLQVNIHMEPYDRARE